MREDDWIAMPGVPLITSGHTKAAADVENGRAGTQCDDARATEEATRPGAENVRDDGAEGPSGETERAEATMNNVVPALTPAGPAAAPEGDAIPALDENVPAAASAEKTQWVTHRRRRTPLRSKPHCSPPAHLGARPPPEPAATESTEPSVLATEAEV
jgi:hypothetical protein